MHSLWDLLLPSRLNPLRFWGKRCMGKDVKTTRSAAFSKLKASFSTALSNIDSCTISGEYKAWILKHYLAPSLFFHFAVNKYHATKMLKKMALSFHVYNTFGVIPPTSDELSSLPSHRDKALSSLLATVSSSSDQLINEASLLSEDTVHPFSCVPSYNS